MRKSRRTFLCAVTWALAVNASAFASEPKTESTKGRQHVVEITGFKFVPENIDVRPGDTITWTNLDIAPHTATSSDGSWDTGTLKLNESKTLTVGEDMTSAYFCQFHRAMTATVNTTQLSK